MLSLLINFSIRLRRPLFAFFYWLFLILLFLFTVFQTIYGEILPIHSNDDVAGLTHFLSGRLLGNPDIARAFAHPQVPGLYREGTN